MARVALAYWEEVPGESLDDYRRRLRAAGLEPVDFCAADDSLADCAGLILTGGVDIDPRLYGETPAPQTQAPLQERDRHELDLLRAALAADLPVLGICRGHQLLNVCFGGGLQQHIADGSHTAQPDRTSRFHVVTLAAASRLADMLASASLVVNSRHHQAVTTARLAPGLTAIATSSDGIVEAVESQSHAWVLGVQWHPERLEPAAGPRWEDASQRLFAAFAAAVGAFT